MTDTAPLVEASATQLIRTHNFEQWFGYWRRVGSGSQWLPVRDQAGTLVGFPSRDAALRGGMLLGTATVAAEAETAAPR